MLSINMEFPNYRKIMLTWYLVQRNIAKELNNIMKKLEFNQSLTKNVFETN